MIGLTSTVVISDIPLQHTGEPCDGDGAAASLYKGDPRESHLSRAATGRAGEKSSMPVRPKRQPRQLTLGESCDFIVPLTSGNSERGKFGSLAGVLGTDWFVVLARAN